MHLAASNALIWRAILSALLVAACTSDLRTRRIPNALVLTVLAAALLRATLVASGADGVTPSGFAAGPASAAMGALCGLALWIPLYAIGAFGAGDVKLFAAAAAWLGPSAVPTATLYVAIAGGVLGFAWLGAQRLAARGASRVPYGVAITAGVLGVVWGNP